MMLAYESVTKISYCCCKGEQPAYHKDAGASELGPESLTHLLRQC